MKFLLLSILAFFSLVACSKRVESVEWTTMGTIASLRWRGNTDISPFLKEAKKEFSLIEELLNAHNPKSELSIIATNSEERILQICSDKVKPCYEMAFEFARLTDNLFNPKWRGEYTLDLGAIAKGFAVDCATEKLYELSKKEGIDLLVDLGGTLRSVRGVWKVAIAHSDLTLTLQEGEACATSATYFRGSHICDGRNGKVITNDLVSVTVKTNGDAMRADALSTVMFLLGSDKGNSFLQARNKKDEKVIWNR